MHLSSPDPVIFEVNVGNNLHRCAVFVQVKSELNAYDNSGLDMDMLYGSKMFQRNNNYSLDLIPVSEQNNPNAECAEKINVYPGFVRIAPYQNTLIPVMINNCKYHTCSLTVYVEDPSIGCIANELLFNRQNIEICRSEETNKIMIKYIDDNNNNNDIAYGMGGLLPQCLLNNMKNYGWNNTSLWNEITEEDLKLMGFKKGHISIFFEKCLDIMNALNGHNPNNDILNYIKYVLCKSWNLPIYIFTNMCKNGWIDPCDWHLIQDIHFQKMDFKDGHIIKFKKGIANNRHILEINEFQNQTIIINENINNINEEIKDDCISITEQESKVDVDYNQFVQNEEFSPPNISDDDDDDDDDDCNDDYVPHPIPIICGIKCKAITTKECRVRWKAYFSVKDKTIDIDNIENITNARLYMKIINREDEKDNNDPIQSPLLKFDINEEKYEYKLTGLKQATSYKMEILLFESRNGELDGVMKQIELEKALNFNFKTLRYDFYEKPFIYQSDYDKNGICYYLGTRFGTQKWENPSLLKLCKLTSTGWEEGNIHEFVGRHGVMSYASHKEYAWIAIDFGEKIKIKVNCYTLRHSNAHKGFYLRNWNFEGSTDAINWTVIKKHRNDKTFKKKGQSHSWAMNNSDKYYQHFRIIMSNTDSSGCWYMMGTGFEIYGYLTGNK